MCILFHYALSIPSLGGPIKSTFINALGKEPQMSLKNSLLAVLSWLEMMMEMA